MAEPERPDSVNHNRVVEIEVHFFSEFKAFALLCLLGPSNE